FYFPATRICDKQFLDLPKRRAIYDGFVLAFEPLAAMMDLTEVDPVFQEISEWTVGEGNATLVLSDLGAASFSHDASRIEIRDQFAERLQFDVPAEDRANGLGLGLVDDELFVLA